jgi:hypothetical protein
VTSPLSPSWVPKCAKSRSSSAMKMRRHIAWLSGAPSVCRPKNSWETAAILEESCLRTVFRHAAFAEAARHVARLRTDHHPPESGRQANAAMKASVAAAAGRDASRSGAAPDTDAPIFHSVGHASQMPSRLPDHQLPIRYGHGVRRRTPRLENFSFSTMKYDIRCHTGLRILPNFTGSVCKAISRSQRRTAGLVNASPGAATRP